MKLHVIMKQKAKKNPMSASLAHCVSWSQGLGPRSGAQRATSINKDL